MADTAATLKVGFDADLGPLMKAVDDAKAKTRDFTKDARNAADDGMRRMESGAGNAAVSIRNLVSAAAAYKALEFGKHAVEVAASLDSAARAAGMSAEAFQRFQSGAKLSGVTGDVAGAMRTFAEKSAEARLRVGELFETLKFISPALAKQLTETKNTSQALDVYAEAIRRVEGHENKAVLAKKAFGDAGVELLPVLARGAQGLAEMERAADKFTTKINDDAIKASKALKVELGLLADEATAHTANALTQLSQAAAKTAADMRAALKGMGTDTPEIGFMKITGMFGDIEAVRTAINGVTKGLNELQNDAKNPTIWQKWFGTDINKQIESTAKTLEALDAQLSALEAKHAARDGKLPDFTTTVSKGGADDALKMQQKPDYRGIDAVMQAAQALASAKGELENVAKMEGATQLENARRVYAELAMSEKQYAQVRRDVTAATEAKVVELRRQTTNQLRGLEAEAQRARENGFDAIRLEMENELSNYQHDLEAKKISEEQFQQARVALHAIAGKKIKDEFDRVREETLKNTADIAQAIESSLGNALTGQFNSARDAARSFTLELMQGLQKAVSQALILKPLMDSIKNSLGNALPDGLAGAIGGTGSSGWITSIARAEGGAVTGGVPTMVNERAGRMPEVFVPNVSGRIIPGERYNPAGGSSTSNVYNIDARGADAGVSNRIMGALAATEAQRPNSVEAQREFVKRYPTRR